MKEKERGRRKKTERARKWRVWALMMRFDSEKTVQRSIEGGAAVAMEDLGIDGVERTEKNPIDWEGKVCRKG